MKNTSSKRNTLAGSVGNILEWYDFAVFGFLAPVMSGLFFPSDDPLAGLVKTYGVFAAGYLMRPLGGIIFGNISDRLGRKKALQLSIMMMALPTFLVGCLPTHDQVGAMAAVLLITLRLFQGVSVGGELVSSISYLVETAPPEKRGYQGSWTLFTAVGGILLGSALVTTMHNTISVEAMQEWGWRLPFLSGIIIAGVGIWLRKSLPESPEFEKAKGKGEIADSPVKMALKEAPGRILQLSAMILLYGTGFYMLFVWMPTYYSKIIQPPIEHALMVNTISMIFLICVIPVAGWLSDRFGRKKILSIGIICTGVSAYPLFSLIDTGVMMYALTAQLIFALFIGLIQGPTPALMVEMFPAKIRNSAIGIGYNLTLAIFGGTAPLICTWLIKESGDIAAPAIYLIVLAVISLIALSTVKIKDGES